LKRGGKSLVLQREDGSGGEWQEFSLKPATERENPNKGFRMIGFSAPAAARLELRVSWQALVNPQ
jgi:hypothetical protein